MEPKISTRVRDLYISDLNSTVGKTDSTREDGFMQFSFTLAKRLELILVK